MKNFLILALLMSTSCASAAVLPPVSSLTIGGQVALTPTASKYKTLVGIYSNSPNSASGLYSLNGSAAAYQVPVGKSFRIMTAKCTSDVTGTPPFESIALGYADNSLGFSTGLGSLVNSVTWATDGSSVFSYLFPPGVNEVAFGPGFLVPTGKYPYVAGRGVTTVSCMIYGQEE